MAIRKIFQEKESNLLLKRSREATNFDGKLSELLDDMKETLKKAEGVGLAAPQLGILRRVAIVDADGFYLEMINPVIVDREGQLVDKEGCLSGEQTKNCEVIRPAKIVLKAFDRAGQPYEMTIEGYNARVVCHELDHLDGILFYTRKTSV
jgi:peptide deformylase